MAIIHKFLTAEDLHCILCIADRRNHPKELCGVTSGRVDSKKTDLGIHIEGVMGEWVLADELGIPVNREVYLHGDCGIDYEFNYWRVQTKTYPYNGPNFRVYLNDIRDFKSSDVLVPVRLVNIVQLDILGCISREKFAKRCKPCNWGYGPRVSVAPEDLDDLSILREAVPVPE